MPRFGSRCGLASLKECRSWTITRRRSVVCNAFGPDPYEPLERAIQVINRVLSVGERNHKRRINDKKVGVDAEDGKGKHAWRERERWVQFGAVTVARVPLADCLIPGLADDHETASLLLQEYLALPVDQYALLDPKWVERETNTLGISQSPDGRKITASQNAFRVSVPLEEMLGVDLQPQLSITAHPDPEAGNVTLMGSKAALGSPEFDQAFKLNLVAVLSRRKKNGGLHIPGRPVQRLRRWAAQRRGSNGVQVHEQVQEQEQEQVEVESTLASTDNVNVNDLSTSAPFPLQQVYMSQDEEELQKDESFGSELAGEVQRFHREETELGAEPLTPSLNNRVTLLDCRVNVTVAIRVPGPLRVVPNPLLGYAGSLVVRSALNAAVPNFMNLLLGDFRRWAKAGRKRTDVPNDELEPGEEWSNADLFGLSSREEGQKVDGQGQLSK